MNLLENANRYMYEDEYIEDQHEYVDIIKKHSIFNIIKDAGLESEWNDYPEGLSFDLAEAIHMYIIDYNDNTEHIAELQQLLHELEFRAAPSLASREDLENYGQMLYDQLVNTYERDTSDNEVSSDSDEELDEAETVEVDGRKYKVKLFKSDDDTNKFLEKNKDWGVIKAEGKDGDEGYTVYVAKLSDKGEKI